MLVGDGIKMAEVRQILGDPRCQPFYTLAGLVRRRKLLLTSRLPTSFLSPHVPNADGSKFFGSPTKLFEYMAMAKPILASDLDQIGEVLRDSLSTDCLPERKPTERETQVAMLTPPADVDAIIAGLRFHSSDRTGENLLVERRHEAAMSGIPGNTTYRRS